MPELAEVEWFRKQWDPGLGDKILKVDLHATKRIFRETNTRDLRRLLTGAKLLDSAARGKRMLFKFSGDNPEMIGARENIRSWLGIHLGMTGSLRVEAAEFAPAKHDHLVLRQRARSLVFRDSRQFGRVRFHHGKNEPDWWSTAAPEIVSPEFDRNYLDKFIGRHRKAPVKAVLLLQSGFSGIGNWMADEILWRAKIRPAKPAGRLTAVERASLFRETRLVARKSLQTTGETFADPPRGWLIHERWRKGGNCPIHRTLLRRAVIGGRTTAWCAKCQK
jgi:formamidopyrimidine-DNA glycosylase